MKDLPAFVKIVEVGPRDGLQNEAQNVATDLKIKLIEDLAAAGLSVVESASFVSPKWIPQMADSAQVMQGIKRQKNVSYPALIPNMKGLERALACDVKEIAIFAAASESFCQRNINCSIKESIERFMPVIKKAQAENLKIRGYISCVLGCPYEGDVDVTTVVDLADKLYQAGCYEISLGDTIGIGTPLNAQNLMRAVSKKVPLTHLAGHFHDTYGQALANILACLQIGIATFDSAIAGLGGCPYAKGATGNVATEDLLYMLAGLNIKTGIDLKKVITIGKQISQTLRRANHAKVGVATV